MASPEEIEKLIARCALSDRSALSPLYEATSAKLFGVLLRVLNDRSDAEDALQEVYIKIWHRADRFRANEFSPLSWLVVITRNHAIDVLRARKPISVEVDEAFDVSSDAKNPEEEAINSSEGTRIDNCLQELETERAQAVRGAYVDGYSYVELAERYAVPVNTMRTWLRRSLLSLRKCLER
ncbi:MAG: sigma-70 family RNA polymerase sigma factor [Pseudomonadota bacterium]